MKLVRIALTVAFVLAISTSASATASAPIVSVDADPGTAGIQATTVVAPGSSFSIDIVIEYVDPVAPLNAFELDLFFDPSVLSATSAVDGGFLLDPTFVVQNSIGVMSVEFAEVTLLPFGASGSGVLVTITFDAIGGGTSVLDLQNVILSAPFGVEILTEAINDGAVSVVPEPSSALLFSVGMLVVGGKLRRRAA